jgi:hypothetical protein
MRKILSIFLLCIFLYNTIGYYLAFKAVQMQVRKEVQHTLKQNLSKSQLTAITINKDSVKLLEWKEKGKEFHYQGELYDIVKSDENASAITFYCINDKQEEILFADLDRHITTHIAADKPIKNSTSKKLVDHVVKLYFSNEQSYLFLRSEISSIPNTGSFDYLSNPVEITSPPPELA